MCTWGACDHCMGHGRRQLLSIERPASSTTQRSVNYHQPTCRKPRFTSSSEACVCQKKKERQTRTSDEGSKVDLGTALDWQHWIGPVQGVPPPDAQESHPDVKRLAPASANQHVSAEHPSSWTPREGCVLTPCVCSQTAFCRALELQMPQGPHRPLRLRHPAASGLSAGLSQGPEGHDDMGQQISRKVAMVQQVQEPGCHDAWLVCFGSVEGTNAIVMDARVPHTCLIGTCWVKAG